MGRNLKNVVNKSNVRRPLEKEMFDRLKKEKGRREGRFFGLCGGGVVKLVDQNRLPSKGCFVGVLEKKVVHAKTLPLLLPERLGNTGAGGGGSDGVIGGVV